jgi:hypothetical protein
MEEGWRVIRVDKVLFADAQNPGQTEVAAERSGLLSAATRPEGQRFG